jgi:hypothetical protein
LVTRQIHDWLRVMRGDGTVERHASHIDWAAELRAIVARVEIKFAVRPENKRVQVMVVIALAGIFE